MYAYNLAFDYAVLKYQAPEWLDLNLPVMDIQAMSLYNGLGASLGECARNLGIEGKDPEGAKLIRQYCTPSKYQIPISEQDLKAFNEYVKHDVLLTEQVFKACAPLPEFEYRIWKLNREVNERGVPFDASLLHKMVEFYACGVAKLDQYLKARTGAGLHQVAKLKDFLGLENIHRATLLEFVKTTADPIKRSVAQARLNGAKSAVGRVKKISLRLNSKQRVVDAFRYYGAHTGRFTSLGVQLHNLPRETLEDPEVERVSHMDSDSFWSHYKLEGFNVLKKCLRPSISQPGGFIVGDFDQIEARITVWLAGGEWDTSRDYYQEMAEAVSPTNPNRQLGKAIVLGCGFGMGAKTFQRTASTMLNIDISEEEARCMVRLFRRKNPKVVALWDRLIKTLELAVAGKQSYKVGDYIVLSPNKIKLPSGRHLHMPYLGFQDYQLANTFRGTPMTPQILIENIVQATARDILGAKMISLAEANLDILFTVHDEIIIDPKAGAFDLFQAILNAPVDWAPGLPVTASCTSLPLRYGKH